MILEIQVNGEHLDITNELLNKNIYPEMLNNSTQTF